VQVIRKFWQAYKQSAWIPFVVFLVLLLLPSTFLQSLFSTYNPPNNSPSYLEWSIPIIIGLIWLLAFVSIITMMIVGLNQFRQGMKSKGIINLLIGLIGILIFVIPVLFFFISPVGVGNG